MPHPDPEPLWRVEQERAHYQRKYEELRAGVLGAGIVLIACLLWYYFAA